MAKYRLEVREKPSSEGAERLGYTRLRPWQHSASPRAIRSVKPGGVLHAHNGQQLKCAAQCLVPRLWCSDADDLVLPVTHIQVQMGEEFRLGEGIGRIDA